MKKVYIGFLSLMMLIFSLSAVHAVPTTFSDMDTQEGLNIEHLLMVSDMGNEQAEVEYVVNIDEGASSGDGYFEALNYAAFEGDVQTDIPGFGQVSGDSNASEIADADNTVNTGSWSGLPQSQAGSGAYYPSGLAGNMPGNSNTSSTPNQIDPPRAIAVEILNGLTAGDNDLPTLKLTFPGNGKAGELFPAPVASWNNGMANRAGNNGANQNKLPNFGQLNSELKPGPTPPVSTPVSEPATILLVGAGLLGLGFVSKKRLAKK